MNTKPVQKLLIIKLD